MLSVGGHAPEFSLAGTAFGDTNTYDLSERTDNGENVLLLFYPADFSPVCVTQLCTIRDASWFEFTPNLNVWGISGDSVYAHQAFADEYDLTFPLLSDSNGAVASTYNVRYDEWQGHREIPKRAIFLVDTDRQIRYAWSSDDAYRKPDFAPVKEATDALQTDNDGASTSG